MVDEPPGYKDAFDAVGQAAFGVRAAEDALPSGDPRLVKANYLIDDLRLAQTLLAPRANVPIAVSDDRLASKLGGYEYDAQVVGESLGGKPAPRQQVNPELGKTKEPSPG